MYQLTDGPLPHGCQFMCNDCNRTFRYPRNLRNHKCSYCRRCRRIFSTYQKFHNHKTSVCRYELDDIEKNSTSDSFDIYDNGSEIPFPAKLTMDSTPDSLGSCDIGSERLMPATEFNPGDIVYVKEEVDVQDEEIIGVDEGDGDEEFISAEKCDFVIEEAEDGEDNATDSSQRHSIFPSSMLWHGLTSEDNIIASATRGKVIECKAAVAWEPCKPLVMETVEVSPPKSKEVRIKIAYSGLCHCDRNALQGKILPKPKFPIILGHEGSGIIESVGEGVTSVKEGDHVVTFPMMRCQECTHCKAKDRNVCQGFFKSPEVAGLMADGTSRLTCKGQTIYNHLTNSTFSQYTVVEESQVVKVSKIAPLDTLCLLGCGVPTGFGAAVNTAKVKPGSTCAIFGLGTVGLSAVMGCKHRGAAKIIGIDINNAKKDIAKKFGMTEFYNPNDFDKPISEVLVERTQGGCDYTFECIGNKRVMESALDTCHASNSRCILVRGAPPGEKIDVDPYRVIFVRLMGTILGGYLPKDVPKLVEFYLEKEVLLDELITSTSSIEEINEAFENMDKETAIKHVFKL